ncbi:MAG: MerR family transcriptional regulator [Acidobacteriota bacterium]
MAKVDAEVYRPADACRIAEVAPYVLRYWETEFPVLAEGKERGGTKFYTAREVRIIARIRELLYDEGFTVAGAKKRLEAEIQEGRFEQDLAAAPSLRDQRKKVATPVSRAGDQPSVLKSSPAAAAAAVTPAPAKESAAPEPSGPDYKSVVRELKEIVKLLGPDKKS